MKWMSMVVLVAVLALAASPLVAQEKSAPPTTASAAFDQEVSHLEKGFIGLAEAMPEDKYNFRPTAGKFDGVMDFAGQVKHVAGGISMYAAAILGEKEPAEPTNLKTKVEMVEYLKKSFEYAHKAAASINDQNVFASVPPPFGKNPTTRFSLAIAMVSHPNDHYGQMIEYLRGAGVIPPGSK